MQRPSSDDRPDAPLRYVVECQPVHERLREVAVRLGGLSLLAMLGRMEDSDFEAPLRQARAVLAEAHDALGAIRVPSRAGHHFHHVGEAARGLERVAALLAAGPLASSGEARREISAALRAASDHLRFAGNAMPGFETVDFRNACCAAHAAAVLAAEPAELKF